MTKLDQAATRRGAQGKARALAKIQSVVIVAVVAIAALAVGLFVATRGPSTTPVTTLITTTPVVPTSPTTTLAPSEAGSCFVGFAYVYADLTTRRFTVRGPPLEVVAFAGATMPRDAVLSVTVLTAEGNEPVATHSWQSFSGAAGTTFKAQIGAGSYYLQFAPSAGVIAYGGFHIHAFEPKTGAEACPANSHLPELNLAST